MISVFDGKCVVLAVTGSIAAYKSVDLASKLTQAGAQVDVILTESAKRFVTPLTFQSVTGRQVYDDLWTGSAAGLPTHIAHVGLGEGADVLLISPATANTLAKLAHGLADNLLTVTALAARCPVMVAPAMDGGMYQHPATQANIETLLARGVILIEPEVGRFASGLEGRGRLPETPVLMGHLRRVLGANRGLGGRHVVVTAGGTREPLDPVRFISNHSSGKQGYAITQAALDYGADVTLISTVQHMPAPIGAELVEVETAHQMRDAVLNLADCDVLVMAAAVADLRPASVSDQKIKKQNTESTLALDRNDDILALVGELRRESGRPLVSVGFAAETQNLVENAQGKLEKKNLDLIIANDLTAPGAGFSADTNIVTVISRGHAPESLPITTKMAVAEMIMERAVALLNSSQD
jgi:phosphopantothenoylcysteine decarboxylase/phosphopantothenate--cysteine ligase